jgi:uncharacterized Rmd1/YagE family protein
MKKILIASFAVLSLAACGKETVIREVLVTTPVTEAPTTTTEYVAPTTNKFEEYLYDLKEFSGKANTMDDAFLIEFGSLVCQAFDNNTSLNEVVSLLQDNSAGRSDDELYAGIIMSAVVNICPEHKAMVEAGI